VSAEALVSEGGLVMKYVYFLKSLKFPNQKYVGVTSDVNKRLKEHNQGKCYHTSKYLPWKLITYTYFADSKKAADFEKYLKGGSGRAFSNRHF